jgi:hypothetical protein
MVLPPDGRPVLARILADGVWMCDSAESERSARSIIVAAGGRVVTGTT